MTDSDRQKVPRKISERKNENDKGVTAAGKEVARSLWPEEKRYRRLGQTKYAFGSELSNRRYTEENTPS